MGTAALEVPAATLFNIVDFDSAYYINYFSLVKVNYIAFRVI